MILLAVFVVASASSVLLCMSNLCVSFNFKDKGEAKEFLNIQLNQRPGSITVDQEPYIRSILDKYRMYALGEWMQTA